MHITDIKRKLKGRKEQYAYKHKHYAVLVPLIKVDNSLHLLFQVRSHKLNNQPGEISFPGGKVEFGESWTQAAKRECQEELLISSTYIDWICELDIVSASHSKTIHTGLAELKCSMSDIFPNKDEVAEVFTVPLSFFMNTSPDNYLVDINCSPKESFPFDQIPNGREYSWHRGNFDVPFYYYEKRIIWGLTARIIMNLVEILKLN